LVEDNIDLTPGSLATGMDLTCGRGKVQRINFESGAADIKTRPESKPIHGTRNRKKGRGVNNRAGDGG